MNCFDLSNLEIEIIQGDSYIAYLTVKKNGEPIDPELIEHIYFTSENLHLQKTFLYDINKMKYLLMLTNQETNELRPGSYTFDITIYFLGNESVITKIYNGNIYIKKKNNPIDLGD